MQSTLKRRRAQSHKAQEEREENTECSQFCKETLFGQKDEGEAEEKLKI